MSSEHKTESMSLHLEELRPLLEDRECPSDRVEGFSEMLNHLDKCLVIELPLRGASVARHPGSFLHSSDLFARYVAACRAHDWQKVAVIEHEICS